MQANHGHAGAASRDCVDDCERLNSACEGATELCEVRGGNALAAVVFSVLTYHHVSK